MLVKCAMCPTYFDDVLAGEKLSPENRLNKVCSIECRFSFDRLEPNLQVETVREMIKMHSDRIAEIDNKITVSSPQSAAPELLPHPQG
jgi:hypothetical protein